MNDFLTLFRLISRWNHTPAFRLISHWRVDSLKNLTMEGKKV